MASTTGRRFYVHRAADTFRGKGKWLVIDRTTNLPLDEETNRYAAAQAAALYNAQPHLIDGDPKAAPIEGGTVECDTCGERHPATYHHDGQFGEGPVYEVTCTRDGLADYYLTERVSVTA